MTKSTHTHTGNCQACGRDHAIDNAKGVIAKHGYTVDWGQFLGVCGGSDRKPAQVSVQYTHVVMDFCTRTAIELDQRAHLLETNVISPDKCIHYDATIEWTTAHGFKRTGKNVEIDFAQGTEAEQSLARSNEINECRHHAEGNRGHVAFLKASILPLLGTALHEVAEVARAHAAARAKKAAAPTKAGFKRQLESLGREYRKAERIIRDALLQIDRDARPVGFDAAYDMPFDLHNWRVKHTRAVVAVLPQMASTCAEIELLFDRRETIKAQQKAAGL